MSDLPRGIRNHNPGNIERTRDRWQGMAADQSADPRFVVFTAPEFGIRALVKLLLNYERMGFDSPRKIITRFAPHVENKTDAYVANVARALGVGPDDVVDLDRFDVMLPLVKAIIQQENGRQPYSAEVLREGLRLGGVADAPARPKLGLVQIAAGGLATAAGYSEPIRGAADALTPFGEAPAVNHIRTALLTLAALMVLAGLLAAWLRARKGL